MEGAAAEEAAMLAETSHTVSMFMDPSSGRTGRRQRMSGGLSSAIALLNHEFLTSTLHMTQ